MSSLELAQMPSAMREMPEEERPRERLEHDSSRAFAVDAVPGQLRSLLTTAGERPRASR